MEQTMSRFASVLFAVCTAPLAAGLVAGAAAQTPDKIPDFSGGGWRTRGGEIFIPVPGAPEPTGNDSAHPYIHNVDARRLGVQPTFRISDLNNPNIKQWAKDLMKKDNDEVLGGKTAYTPGSSCRPYGVPAIWNSGGPFFFIQTPKEVVIVSETDRFAPHLSERAPYRRSQTLLLRRIRRPLRGRHPRGRHDRHERQDLCRQFPHPAHRKAARHRAHSPGRGRQEARNPCDGGGPGHLRAALAGHQALQPHLGGARGYVRGHLPGRQSRGDRLRHSHRRQTGFLNFPRRRRATADETDAHSHSPHPEGPARAGRLEGWPNAKRPLAALVRDAALTRGPHHEVSYWKFRDSEIRLRCYRHMEIENIQVVLGADLLGNKRLLPALVAHTRRPWLVEGLGIVHRDTDLQPLSRIDRAPALHDMQLFGVRRAIDIENGLGVLANRIDHQRVALIMAYRFSGPGGFRIRRMRHIEIDVPNLVCGLLLEKNNLRRLKDHERRGG